MIFKINKENKNAIQRKISKGKKSVRITRGIGRWILITGVGSSLIYLALNYLIPSWSLAEIGGVVQKNYDWIFYVAVTGVGCSVFLYFCCRALAGNLGSSNNAERIEESLILDKDILRYTFRIIHQSNPRDRNVITLPLKNIQQVQYTTDTKSLIFKGSFLSDYVEDYSINNTSSGTAEEIDEMIIYDYFKPSLFDTLKENGVNILE